MSISGQEASLLQWKVTGLGGGGGGGGTTGPGAGLPELPPQADTANEAASSRMALIELKGMPDRRQNSHSRPVQWSHYQ